MLCGRRSDHLLLGDQDGTIEALSGYLNLVYGAKNNTYGVFVLVCDCNSFLCSLYCIFLSFLFLKIIHMP
jgi:hypothetical protein